ncbi:MAG TPA: ribosomal protein L7/L12 [Opitutales bacterium]|nr:ribosomal protein L7/L12 [Opitutales bacterium]
MGFGIPPGLLFPLLVAALVGVIVLCRLIAGGGPGASIGPAPTMEDVKRLAAAGNKIAAIKAYRMIHRVGLKEAKDAVEALDPK